MMIKRRKSRSKIEVEAEAIVNNLQKEERNKGEDRDLTQKIEEIKDGGLIVEIERGEDDDRDEIRVFNLIQINKFGILMVS